VEVGVGVGAEEVEVGVGVGAEEVEVGVGVGVDVGLAVGINPDTDCIKVYSSAKLALILVLIL
jgi:hypothetical protein